MSNTILQITDPDQNFLARKLKALRWLDPLTPEELLRVKGIVPRRVAGLPDFKTWGVRFYLGGAQRPFGYTTEKESAARFADMVRGYFWKYRTRGVGDPVGADLNFSPERLAKDLAGESEAVALLKEIEDHLLKTKIIFTAAEREAKLKERKEGGRLNRTVAGSFEVMGHEWSRQLTAIISRLDAVAIKQSGHSDRLRELAVKLDNLEKRLDQGAGVSVSTMPVKLDRLANNAENLGLLGRSQC